MDKIEVLGLYNITNRDKFILNFINNNSINIEFEYLSDFIHTKILRDYIKDICILMWLDSKNITRLILIIDEMNNNSIEYWSKKWDLNKLRVNITKKIDKNQKETFELIVEVEDSWKWSRPKKALEMETLRAHQLKLWYAQHSSIRWRGLFMIIVNLVDRLYFKDTSSWWLIVWIKKKIII